MKTVSTMPSHHAAQIIANASDHANLGSLKNYHWLASGFISDAYEFETEQGKFVLLQNKPTAAHESDYRYYYANLQLVEAAGYINAPRALYLSDDDGTIIITKASGRNAVDVSDLTEVDQQRVAFNISEALQALADIRKEDVDSLYNSLGLPASGVMSEDEDWKVFVLDRFIPFKNGAPADARTEWIESVLTDEFPSW
jgi:hypothetical protein